VIATGFSGLGHTGTLLQRATREVAVLVARETSPSHTLDLRAIGG